jgi:hypothetical protein
MTAAASKSGFFSALKGIKWMSTAFMGVGLLLSLYSALPLGRSAVTVGLGIGNLAPIRILTTPGNSVLSTIMVGLAVKWMFSKSKADSATWTGKLSTGLMRYVSGGGMIATFLGMPGTFQEGLRLAIFGAIPVAWLTFWITLNTLKQLKAEPGAANAGVIGMTVFMAWAYDILAAVTYYQPYGKSWAELVFDVTHFGFSLSKLNYGSLLQTAITLALPTMVGSLLTSRLGTNLSFVPNAIREARSRNAGLIESVSTKAIQVSLIVTAVLLFLFSALPYMDAGSTLLSQVGSLPFVYGLTLLPLVGGAFALAGSFAQVFTAFGLTWAVNWLESGTIAPKGTSGEVTAGEARGGMLGYALDLVLNLWHYQPLDGGFRAIATGAAFSRGGDAFLASIHWVDCFQMLASISMFFCLWTFAINCAPAINKGFTGMFGKKF